MKRTIGLIISVLLMGFHLAFAEEIQSLNAAPELHGELADLNAFGISGEHFITQATMTDIIELIESKETFIAFFGYHSCAWCKSIAPVLQDISNTEQIEIRFVDIMADENRRKDDMLALDTYLEDFTLNYQGRIGVNTPRVSAILHGEEIALHIGTFPGHDPYTQALTPEQIQELRTIFEKMIAAVRD